MDHLEEIRSRISIEELVGGYVQLKKAGRNLKGLCPFHNEKTPSFIVSPEKGIAYCFGCHQGGDIFKFTQLVENTDFGDAVKILAQKANVTLPRLNPQSQNKRLRTIEANEKATAFFVQQLPANKKAAEYFKNRRLSNETIQTFKLGYSPDSFDALKSHLTSEDFTIEELLEAGLINQKSIADKNTYDRFRGRLMFPIFDHQGNTVGFSGRIIEDGEPKYINSPDTPAYNKSTVLYGLNFAKNAIKEKNLAIIVEGNMDVITAHQAGTQNVVAMSGTALTPQQLKLLKRFTPNIALSFDQDNAGMEATFRAIELAQIAEMNVKVILIPDGKDPDDCIKNNPENWKKATENPVNVMDFYFSYAEKQFNKETIEGKKEYLNLLLPLIALYPSEVEKGEYLGRLSTTLKTDVKLLWEDLKKAKKPYASQKEAESPIQKKRIFGREEFLLGFIFKSPKIYEYVHENLIRNIPFDPATDLFYKNLEKVYTPGSSLDLVALKETLPPEASEKIDVLSLMIEEAYPDFPDDLALKEVANLVREINRKNVRSIQKEYEFKIRETEDVGKKKLLLNQYNEILKLSSKLN